MREKVEIRKIRTDGGTQTRAGLNSSTLADYVQLLQDSGGEWPFKDPVELVFDGSDYWLVDGFHRVSACKQWGRLVALANVNQGTQRDAILLSVGVNADHGLPRSHDDKRRAVQRLLEDDEWNKWSDREIARRCKVSAPLVGKLRKELTVNIYSDQPAERTYVRNGVVATMNTSNIGRDYANPDVWDDETRRAKIQAAIERVVRSHDNFWYRSGVFTELAEQGEDHSYWEEITFPDWARPSEIQAALQVLSTRWPSKAEVVISGKGWDNRPARVIDTNPAQESMLIEHDEGKTFWFHESQIKVQCEQDAPRLTEEEYDNNLRQFVDALPEPEQRDPPDLNYYAPVRRLLIAMRALDKHQAALMVMGAGIYKRDESPEIIEYWDALASLLESYCK